MSELIVFGSDKCPDCPLAIKILEEKNIDFEFINITDSMINLKKFLKIRDSRSEFEDIKINGSVGIPCFFKNDEIHFNIEEIL